MFKDQKITSKNKLGSESNNKVLDNKTRTQAGRKIDKNI